MVDRLTLLFESENFYNIIVNVGDKCSVHVKAQINMIYCMTLDATVMIKNMQSEFTKLGLLLSSTTVYRDPVADVYHVIAQFDAENLPYGNISGVLSSSPDPNQFQKCQHLNKKINHAGGVAFWYCPDCKSDLGDA